MRTTVDIPDAMYSELRSRAARERTSVKSLILRGVEISLAAHPAAKMKRLKRPIVRSTELGSVTITNDEIDELLFS